MQINRQKLLNILKKVFLGVDPKSKQQQQRWFTFCDNHVFASNGLLSIDGVIDFQVGDSFAVNAESLINVLSSIKDDEVTFVYNEDCLHIENEKTNIDLVITPMDRKEPFEGEIEFIQHVSPFLESLMFCVPCVSKNVNDSIIRGVILYKDGFVGFDKIQMRRVCGNNLSTQRDISIHPKILKVVMSLYDEITDIGFNKIDGSLMVKTQDVVLHGSILKGEHPDFDGLCEQINDFIEIPVSEEFVNILEKHYKFLKSVGKYDRKCKIVCANGEAKIITKNQAVGRITDKLKVVWDDFEVVFNLEMLDFTMMKKSKMFLSLENRIVKLQNGIQEFMSQCVEKE